MMKPWMWITIAAIFLIVIIYAIYAWQKSQEEERKLAALKIAAEQEGTTTEERSNIWRIISGITGVLGEEDFKFKRA